MLIEFDERTHTYMINGEIATTSVTKLLAKHKLTNNYDGIDERVLKRKAEYGNRIHKDIEMWLNKKPSEAYEPQTIQCRLFIDYFKKNIDSAVSEQKIGLEYADTLSICGSVDLIGFNKQQELIIADHKTYANMTKETENHIAWQLSIYDYMLCRCKEINGKKIKWFGAKHLYIYWYKKDNTMEIIEVDRIPDSEIENLFECEVSGITYRPRELILPSELEKSILEGELRVAKLELETKKAQEQVERNREQLKELMEKQKIVKWESPNGIIKVNYSSAYQRDGIDMKKLKAEYPKVFNECYKAINVKANVKVKCDIDKYIELGENKDGLLDI